jgi:Holliday junction resolvasome RuvABC endonuclease subunit
MIALQGQGPVLLVLDAGSWETGWAVFRGEEVADTGLIGVPHRGEGATSQVRLDHLLQEMEELAARWQPQAVVLSQPSGLRWRVPALEMVVAGVQEWSQRRRLTLHCYSDHEVRRAVVGRERASGSQLAYAIMALLGTVGQVRTTREWEAVAAGYYHLARHG